MFSADVLYLFLWVMLRKDYEQPANIQFQLTADTKCATNQITTMSRPTGRRSGNLCCGAPTTTFPSIPERPRRLLWTSERQNAAPSRVSLLTASQFGMFGTSNENIIHYNLTLDYTTVKLLCVNRSSAWLNLSEYLAATVGNLHFCLGWIFFMWNICRGVFYIVVVHLSHPQCVKPLHINAKNWPLKSPYISFSLIQTLRADLEPTFSNWPNQ